MGGLNRSSTCRKCIYNRSSSSIMNEFAWMSQTPSPSYLSCVIYFCHAYTIPTILSSTLHMYNHNLLSCNVLLHSFRSIMLWHMALPCMNSAIVVVKLHDDTSQPPLVILYLLQGQVGSSTMVNLFHC